MPCKLNISSMQKQIQQQILVVHEARIPDAGLS